ncbi:MAG: tRNA pseudouridine(55) synthase TruB [Ferrimicrobium sp.]
MARRPSEVGGLYALDKPSGITSQTALTIAKRHLGVRKAGHSGTLDPLASGLLIVGVGTWSRLLAFIVGADKTYHAVIRCGLRTDSLDITGAIQGVGWVPPTVDVQVVEECLARLRGAIWQTPPAFSALKVHGARAYELARAGQDVALASRQVTISSLALLGLRRTGPFFDIELRVRCSSGTYIRSLASDLGDLLGTGATLFALRREAIGSVTLASASEPDVIGREQRLPLSLIFPEFGRFEVDETELVAARNGRWLACPDSLASYREVIVLAAGDAPEFRRLVGIYRVVGDRLVPSRIVPTEGTT